MQDNGAIHMGSISMAALEEVLGERFITWGIQAS
jgi:hypothetical protein